ncbi:YjcZ family sporulation protein [Neobacillus drentensis]|uniref:YjcZ family sporulation protein n=1 Tax=Neobacillus drentensis TaxID=220684 RepID=UPI002FFDD859
MFMYHGYGYGIDGCGGFPTYPVGGCGYPVGGVGFGFGGFALIVVLFILLIIIGASWNF